MNRLLARMSTIAFAGVLATAAVTGAAQADPITANVPGCWGAGTNDTVVCNVVISAYPVAPTFEVMYVKVCAGTCQDVPVTWVEPGTQAADVCYSYTNGWGTPRGGCLAPSVASIDLGDLTIDLLDCSRNAICAHQ